MYGITISLESSDETNLNIDNDDTEAAKNEITVFINSKITLTAGRHGSRRSWISCERSAEDLCRI
jgi:hypothetical protein